MTQPQTLARRRDELVHGARVMRLWRHNRRDREYALGSSSVVERYVEEMEELRGVGGRLTWALRLWISTKRGLDSSFDEAEWPQLVEALNGRLNETPGLHERLLGVIFDERGVS